MLKSVYKSKSKEKTLLRKAKDVRVAQNNVLY